MISAPETVEFDIYTDEASVRRAAERIRAGIGLVRPLAAVTPIEPEQRSEARYPLVTPASCRNQRCRTSSETGSSSPASKMMMHVRSGTG